MLTIKLPQMSKFSAEPCQSQPESLLVLVANNEESTRTLLRQAMEREGYQVLEACNKEECLKANKVFQPDIILLDNLMPLADFISQFPVRANLVIPLLPGKQLWGLLIDHECFRQGQWQPWEVEWFQRLASQVAIAIQQHTLLEQVQERTRELQQALKFEVTLKQITDKVRDRLDEVQILQTAVRELAHVLTAGSCKATLYQPEQENSRIS